MLKYNEAKKILWKIIENKEICGSLIEIKNLSKIYVFQEGSEQYLNCVYIIVDDHISENNMFYYNDSTGDNITCCVCICDSYFFSLEQDINNSTVFNVPELLSKDDFDKIELMANFI